MCRSSMDYLIAMLPASQIQIGAHYLSRVSCFGSTPPRRLDQTSMPAISRHSGMRAREELNSSEPTMVWCIISPVSARVTMLRGLEIMINSCGGLAGRNNNERPFLAACRATSRKCEALMRRSPSHSRGCPEGFPIRAYIYSLRDNCTCRIVDAAQQ